MKDSFKYKLNEHLLICSLDFMFRLWIKDSTLPGSSFFRLLGATWATGTTATAGTTVRSTSALLSGSGATLLSRLLLSLFHHCFVLARLLYLGFCAYLFFRKGSDNLLGLIMVDCNNSKLIFDRFSSDILKYSVNLYLLIIIDKYTPHKPPCLLININANIFYRAVLIESFLYIFVCKVAINVLDIKTGVLLQLKDSFYRLALLLFTFSCLLLQLF